MDEDYNSIDPILFKWAQQHSFQVDKEDRDWVVRSIRVPGLLNPDPRGQEAQLWVESPDEAGNINVNVAIGRWSSKQRAYLNELAQVLDAQLESLRSKAK